MGVIQWNPMMSVKVDAMDDQHKKLFNLINQLGDAMLSGKGKDEVGKVLAGLASYTVTHFSVEEKLMASYNYPELDTHKAEHKKLLDKVTDFQKKFKSGEATVTTELMKFLTDWLTNHIQKVDQKYGKFIAAKTTTKTAAGV